MANSLSAYWANFFKAAGFTTEVAMKHALVFSNNRIKPDMLSDLDKPSLREMGITLMGDMIAILRYAKKVVEEKSCEKFLVDSEQSSKVVKKVPKVVKKKVVAVKVVPKPTTSALKADSTTTKKNVPSALVPKTKKVIVKKPLLSTNDISSESPLKKHPNSLKRKPEEMDDDEEDDEAEDDDDIVTVNESPNNTVKKPRIISTTQNKVGYTVIVPTGPIQRNEQILKKCPKSKQTVFDRLGNECLETVNNTNTEPQQTTFNITGLGKDIFKKPPSVFNRLGGKDVNRSNTSTMGVLKNGTAEKMSSGILKTQTPSTRTCLITTKQMGTRSGGTMRADQEQNRMKMSSIVKPTKKITNKIVSNDNRSGNKRFPRSSIGSGKLACEQPASIPAKARLGVARPAGGDAKQVTFSKVTTVTHYKKPYNADVFSRLGY